jgi:hypothetical protein
MHISMAPFYCLSRLTPDADQELPSSKNILQLALSEKMLRVRRGKKCKATCGSRGISKRDTGRVSVAKSDLFMSLILRLLA